MNLRIRPGDLSPELLKKSDLWQLLDKQTSGLWMMRSDTGAVWWSPKLWQTFGYDPASDNDLQDIISLTHPDDRQRHEEAVAASVADRSNYEIEIRMLARGGDYRWLLAQGFWLSAESAPHTLLGFVYDVTSRVNATEAQRRSEALFRSFFDQAPAAVFIKDQQSRHLYGNAMAAEVAGTDLDTFLKSPIDELFTPEATRQLLEVDSQVLKENRAVSWTGPVQTATGKKRYLWDLKFPVQDVETGERCIGGFGVDLTELYETKQKLEVAQRLESLGLLASGIAHDFNNLLFSIAGKTELAMQAGEEERQGHLKSVLAATEHAATLCKQLLTLGGKAHSPRAGIWVKQLLQDSMDLFQLSLQNQCRLETDLADDTGMVRADEGQLQQIVVNLILNACQASPKDGVIRLACHNADLAALRSSEDPRLHSWLPEKAKTGVCVVVEDEGRGIDPALLARIFEPYFSDQKLGHGLGLATVIGTVKSCSGAVKVSSAPVKGTRFECFFPLFEPPRSRPDRKQKTTTNEHSIETAMVIDDDELVANLAQAMLTRAGVKTESYTDSSEAVEILRHRHTEFDLVISDISMPGLEGADVLRVVRDLNHQLPLILSSGDSSRNLNIDNDPCTWFLSKPWSAADLNGLLIEISDSARPESS